MMGLKAKLKNESGVILMASTMGVFIMLSLFAFYLARFSVVETRTGGYHTQDIKARNLAMTGIELGLHSYKSSRDVSNIDGTLIMVLILFVLIASMTKVVPRYQKSTT